MDLECSKHAKARQEEREQSFKNCHTLLELLLVEIPGLNSKVRSNILNDIDVNKVVLRTCPLSIVDRVTNNRKGKGGKSNKNGRLQDCQEVIT